MIPTERNDLVTYAGTMVLGWILGAVMVVAYIGQPSDLDLHTDEPVNAPNYATHAAMAQGLCFLDTGEQDVVKAGPNVVAAHVIVVKLNGSMVRMDTSEAFDRAGSKTRADDIWVVGVCRGDIVKRRVTMKFNPDARLDNSRVRNY